MPCIPSCPLVLCTSLVPRIYSGPDLRNKPSRAWRRVYPHAPLPFLPSRPSRHPPFLLTRRPPPHPTPPHPTHPPTHPTPQTDEQIFCFLSYL